jgi:hypothetical protein
MDFIYLFIYFWNFSYHHATNQLKLIYHSLDSGVDTTTPAQPPCFVQSTTTIRKRFQDMVPRVQPNDLSWHPTLKTVLLDPGLAAVA